MKAKNVLLALTGLLGALLIFAYLDANRELTPEEAREKAHRQHLQKSNKIAREAARARREACDRKKEVAMWQAEEIIKSVLKFPSKATIEFEGAYYSDAEERNAQLVFLVEAPNSLGLTVYQRHRVFFDGYVLESTCAFENIGTPVKHKLED